MGQLILHNNGAYNLYSTVSDNVCFDSALTLAELEEVIRDDLGEQGIRELPARLERAHRTGCSSTDGMTLEECVEDNRAGPDEETMPLDQFVAQFLTLRA